MSDVQETSYDALPLNFDASTQRQLLTDKHVQYSIEKFVTNAKAIQYYTGFDDYDHFMMFFTVLGEAAFHLKYECLLLEPKDQLF